MEDTGYFSKFCLCRFILVLILSLVVIVTFLFLVQEGGGYLHKGNVCLLSGGWGEGRELFLHLQILNWLQLQNNPGTKVVCFGQACPNPLNFSLLLALSCSIIIHCWCLLTLLRPCKWSLIKPFVLLDLVQYQDRPLISITAPLPLIQTYTQYWGI